jgi:hypothetical protein
VNNGILQKTEMRLAAGLKTQTGAWLLNKLPLVKPGRLAAGLAGGGEQVPDDGAANAEAAAGF